MVRFAAALALVALVGGRADAQGTCQDLPDGAPCGSDAQDECTRPDTCFSDFCQTNHEYLGTECSAGYCTSYGSCAAPTHHFIANGTVSGSGHPYFPAGREVALEYSLVSTMPDEDPDPTAGRYWALSRVRLITDSNAIEMGAWGWVAVGYSPGSDGYLVRSNVIDSLIESITLWLVDGTGSVFSSDSLTEALDALKGGAGFPTMLLVLDRYGGGTTGSIAVHGHGVDACPHYSSMENEDSDANGIGDVCECGDQNGDGSVNVLDLIAISRAIFTPSLATPLCDTNNDGLCNVQDIIGANLKIFGQPAYCLRYPPPGL